MRNVVLLVSAAVAIPASAPDTAAASRIEAPSDWRPAVKAANAYANRRAGRISFAVRTSDDYWKRAHTRSVNSASVIKAMLMVTYLNHPDVRSRPLGDRDRALLAPMIRYSDNDTATTVRNYVGNERIVRLSRRAKMRDFRIASAWGLSQINAQDQSRFFLNMPELIPLRHRAYGLKLLRSIVPEQRWGFGKVRKKGWKVHFKGGWGSGSGAVSHQVALLRRGRTERVSVAILTVGNPSHAYSEETLEGVARRLLRNLEDAPLPGEVAAPAPPEESPAPTPSPTATASP